MQKSNETLDEMKCVGISIRTSNALEMDAETAKIGQMVQTFFMNAYSQKIENRKFPGRTLSIYTNYESDEHGEYTYFLGEEVSDFTNIPEGFDTLVIPSQNYVKFTSNSGIMPKVVIDMWQSIWKLKESDLNGERSYIADFEVYDARSQDPQNTILDIYIGIK